MDIKTVRDFWESKPLFADESNFPIGTREYFEEHRKVVREDCFAGVIPACVLPADKVDNAIDVGCGPGQWAVELLQTGKIKKLTCCDLTDSAVTLCKKRLAIYSMDAEVLQANAEQMPFSSIVFDFVSCMGVVHHTPDTNAAVSELSRILKPGGTAVISVYYKNIFLRNWQTLKVIGKIAHTLGARLPGRGREDIYSLDDVDQIVRYYDGADNPVGKAYDRSEFLRLVKPHFEVEKIFYYFFPARTLPFKIPQSMHRLLQKATPFMIGARLKKR